MATRTEPTTAPSVALAQAARQALHAPSVLNTQPWRWRIAGDTLELWADPERQLDVVDSAHRLLTVSCGAALHHALVALAGQGYRTRVDRLADPEHPFKLATIRLDGRLDPTAADRNLLAAMSKRRTDRRAFTDETVPAAHLRQLTEVARRNGSGLHLVRFDQIPMLAVATAQAAEAELADPAYRSELGRWTSRPAEAGDGVPHSVAVQQGPRRIPVRDHALGGPAGLEIGADHDGGASFALLYGPTDTPDGWLRGGEALSAVLLTAVTLGLSTAPVSDPIEVPWPRALTRGLLTEGGEPYLVLRIGYGHGPEHLPPAPRRRFEDVIEWWTGA